MNGSNKDKQRTSLTYIEMKMNCGYSVNKGQSSALLVPASATREAASAEYKGLAASSGKKLGHNSDTFHIRWGLRQTT